MRGRGILFGMYIDRCRSPEGHLIQFIPIEHTEIDYYWAEDCEIGQIEKEEREEWHLQMK